MIHPKHTEDRLRKRKKRVRWKENRCLREVANCCNSLTNFHFPAPISPFFPRRGRKNKPLPQLMITTEIWTPPAPRSTGCSWCGPRGYFIFFRDFSKIFNFKGFVLKDEKDIERDIQILRENIWDPEREFFLGVRGFRILNQNCFRTAITIIVGGPDIGPSRSPRWEERIWYQK